MPQITPTWTLITADDLSGTEPTVVFTAEIANSSKLPGIRVVTEFRNALPQPYEPDPTYYRISTFVDLSDDGGLTWSPLIYQFERYTGAPASPPVQILECRPSIINIDEGVPMAVWDGDRVVAHESRKTGVCTTMMRYRVTVQDLFYGQAGAFQQVEFYSTFQLLPE